MGDLNIIHKNPISDDVDGFGQILPFFIFLHTLAKKDQFIL